MDLLEELRPTTKARVIDLVSAAGIDVSEWSISAKGPVRYPAANPNHCYEWAFTGNQVVVINLWHSELEFDGASVYRWLDLREWTARHHQAETTPARKSAASRRAQRMEDAIAKAYESRLPVRVILGEGSRRDYADKTSQSASRMSLRRLDEETWIVRSYNPDNGVCLIARGSAPHFVDQFSIDRNEELPARSQLTGEVWIRDKQVRDAVLQRAQGVCEFCGMLGFRTATGGIYLETHHVIFLSAGGADTDSNVVAICANDHRRAHFSSDRLEIQASLLAKLSGMRLR